MHTVMLTLTGRTQLYMKKKNACWASRRLPTELRSITSIRRYPCIGVIMPRLTYIRMQIAVPTIAKMVIIPRNIHAFLRLNL